MRTFLLSVVAVVVLFACGKAEVGEDCSENSDCVEATQCILYGAYSFSSQSGPTCDENKKVCSVPCAVDSDCGALGAGHICVEDCFQGSCVKGSRG